MRYCKVAIKADACFLWALLLLILPLRWMFAFLLASLTHELFHIFAILALGKRIDSICIGCSGIQMETHSLSYSEELLCALAGPAGGLALIWTSRWYPELCICGLIQSLYNLLPVYPLDGGRAIKCIVCIFTSKHTDIICNSIELCVLSGILVCTMVLKMGFFMFLTGFFLLGKLMSGKIPCKHSLLRVQ